MRRCDVLIAGGGPSGATCARVLAERGLDVVLLDQARFPRDKPCAGWITPPVLNLLGIDRAEYRRNRVLQPVTGFRISCGADPAVRIRFGETVSYGIRRSEFDEFLLRRSQAEVHEETPVRELERRHGEWVVNGCISAPMLVGAGGHFCPVARRLGARASGKGTVLAQQAEWPHHSFCDPEEPELRFYPDRRGYAWCLQKEGFVNVGLGRMEGGPLGPHRRDLEEWLSTRGVPRAMLPALRGHAYLTAAATRPTIAGEGVLLVGDAAGLAGPRSGEGIFPALESALLAAECILEAKGDYSPGRLQRYAERVRAQHPKGATGMPLPEFVTRALMSRPWFVREVVLKRWFLHLSDAAAPRQFLASWRST